MTFPHFHVVKAGKYSQTTNINSNKLLVATIKASVRRNAFAFFTTLSYIKVMQGEQNISDNN